MADSRPVKVWHDESWSKGILLGLNPDPNSGYRATVWFEYTRALFNQIREGSLIAVRNFSDRSRRPDGSPEGEREATYEEYSILQVDQVHPWHYAIQGTGDQGFPGFITAAAESARQDWTDMDEINRDDVSRIRCSAIPLRLAFHRGAESEELPACFPDRSMPMPGHEAYLLTWQMTDSILNRGIEKAAAVGLGTHVVQHEVTVKLQLPELLRLHFGVFGYTGAGKSNLVSTLLSKALSRPASTDGRYVFKAVVFDLVDEYTGLLIDHLVRHPDSRLVVAGRNALPQAVLSACQAVREQAKDARRLATEAGKDWARRVILPRELNTVRDLYAPSLARLILGRKVQFFEPTAEQGVVFEFDLDALVGGLGTRAYGNGKDFDTETKRLSKSLKPLIDQAKAAEPNQRAGLIDQMIRSLKDEKKCFRQGSKPDKAVTAGIKSLEAQQTARGGLGGVGTSPRAMSSTLNSISSQEPRRYEPSLIIVIGESPERIAWFGRTLIQNTFEDRRTRSLLDPTVSFIFDEADVFISSQQRSGSSEDPRMIDEATLLARRGRKFGLGLGIATQRITYLDTSIMAQPHTYFVSRLPRKSDRERVADAFAISPETLEQTFSFTVGQWLVASHDATGLKGTPFPVQVENANTRVAKWLANAADTQEESRA